MKSKNSYQQHIAEYTKRSNRHKQAMRNIGYKIKLWKEQVKRIEKKEAEMRKIYSIVKEFSGSVEPKTIGRKIFFKYCIENRINGAYVAMFLKTFPTTPARERLRFTRSFKVNKSNKEVWNNFKQFIKDHQ